MCISYSFLNFNRQKTSQNTPPQTLKVLLNRYMVSLDLEKKQKTFFLLTV